MNAFQQWMPFSIPSLPNDTNRKRGREERMRSQVHPSVPRGTAVVAAALALLIAPFAAPMWANNTSLATIEIQSIDLRETAGGVELTVLGDGPLVWTQYRNDAGELVIELPNTVLAGQVLPPAPRGLVSSVSVEPEANGNRPMTRLVVGTSGEAEHTLFVNDGLLTLAFETPYGAVPTSSSGTQVVPALGEPMTTAASDPVVDPEPAGESFESTAVAETTPVNSMPEPISEPTESAPLPSPTQTQTADSGTPEAPRTGPAPSGVRATRLFGVQTTEIDGATILRIEGDGDFLYSTFRLDNPPRFVIDLEGVVNSASRSRVTVEQDGIDQVRMAQFRPYPDPVTRIVLDLSEDASPTLESTGDGLVVRLGAPMMRAEPVRVTDAEAVAEPPAPTEPSSTSEPTESAPSVEGSTEDAVAVADTAPAPMVSEPVGEPDAAATTPAEITDEYADAGLTEPLAPLAVDEPATETAASADPVEVAEFPRGDDADLERTTAEPLYADDSPADSSEPGFDEPLFADEPLEIADETRVESPTTDVSLFEAQQTESAPPLVQRNQEPQGFAVQRLENTTDYVGDPVSFAVKDADLTEVLRTIARYAELNLIVQPGVNVPITIEFESVPWDQALDQILKMTGLDKQLEGNILRVARKDLFRQEAVENQQLAAARALSIPLTTAIKRLSYADAQQVARILTQGQRASTGGGGVGGFGAGVAADTGILSQRGSVSVDQRTNTLILKELPTYLDTVIQVIENLDIPEKQVMIEARVVETSRSFSRTLGIDWSFGGAATAATGNTTGLQFPNRVETGGGVQLLTGGDNGFFNLSLGNVLNTLQLDLALQAAENEGLVNVISAPKIATLNNFPASIETGLQLPVQTVTGGGGTTAGGLVNPFGTVSVNFVRASLRMQVQPQVTFEGTILLNVQIEKDEPQFALQVPGSPSAPISTRRASTRVRVADGGTAVIGGIYQVTTNEGENRVPGLAKIPILGQLFKNRDRSNQNQELLIFITPRVIQQ